MPKLNPYFIPKETFPKVEEVRYLNTEIPTYEEFLKTYQSDERLEALNEVEWQDRLLYGPQYGPGNNHSSEDVAKKVISIGLAVSYFTPFSVVTIPASIAAGATGVGMGVAGKLTDDEDLARAGGHILQVVGESAGMKGDFEDSGLGKMIEYKTKK